MKKAVLKKDLPGVKAGAVYVLKPGTIGPAYELPGYHNLTKASALNADVVENNPDFFEIVIVEEPWRPKGTDVYWHITPTMRVIHALFFNGSDLAESLIKSGNCFRTREQAEEARDKILKVLEEVRRGE